MIQFLRFSPVIDIAADDIAINFQAKNLSTMCGVEVNLSVGQDWWSSAPAATAPPAVAATAPRDLDNPTLSPSKVVVSNFIYTGLPEISI